MTAPAHPAKGPWLQRWLIRFFTVLFGILIYWLLGFLIDDISALSPPDYQALEQKMLDQSLLQQERTLIDREAELRREISTQQGRQTILRDSTNNAQTTMNQLLQFQKLSLEKDVKPSEEEQQALAESQKVFLSNQQQYQQLTEQVGLLQSQLNTVQNETSKLEKELEIAREPVRTEFGSQNRRHDLLVAAIKLAILAPLLIVAVGLFFKLRESIYVPLFVAFAIATGVKVLFVMHEYFPARPFKYVLLFTFLIVVTKALLGLISSLAHPGLAFLLKQYREAYEAFLCPVCNYPIRRGPLKYVYWTRRTVKKLKTAPVLPEEKEAPYCCPACSTKLFEECSACHEIRHSLLPTCEHCGTTTPLTTGTSS
ncbi:hypothetical protein [Planctomicrobium piriforme]|uniref:Zinc ribbon domain-containing protein n=1 Tax=Planctomicrobium piriforme TaxID=1576369 RepID=A0A1I3N7H3_9PLAN|nr:hypothetical protein [Planctomicrobium piriforme]SFJ04816.1 hypothetical protein SAMN05421753_1156 [Planctomicrobium piriforme]